MHHLDEPPDQGDLRHEVGRHLTPGRLVGLEGLVAKRWPWGVHAAEEIVRPTTGDDVEQVAGKTIHSRHRFALR